VLKNKHEEEKSEDNEGKYEKQNTKKKLGAWRLSWRGKMRR
jgi:hypothetical protein